MEEENEAEDSKGLKLLIVDDEPQLLKLLVKNLNGSFEIQTATNGHEALDVLEEFSPDAMIIDWKMPVLTGRKLIQKIRSNPRYEFVPILILTAYGNQLTYNASFQVGADEFLSKPASIEEIEEKIAKMVDNQQFSKRLKKQVSQRKVGVNKDVEVDGISDIPLTGDEKSDLETLKDSIQKLEDSVVDNIWEDGEPKAGDEDQEPATADDTGEVPEDE